MPYRKLVLTVALLLPLAGCALPPIQWFRPGPARFQQAQSTRFDPYPEPDTGPEVVGGRPREFQVPVAEPARSRWWVPWSQPPQATPVHPH